MDRVCIIPFTLTQAKALQRALRELQEHAGGFILGADLEDAKKLLDDSVKRVESPR